MNVFLVKGGYDYEGFEVLGVFDTQEKANQWLDDHIKNYKKVYEGDTCHDYHTIEDFEVK